MNKYKRAKFFGECDFQENYWDWCIEEKINMINESTFEDNTLQDALMNQKILHLYIMISMVAVLMVTFTLYDYEMRILIQENFK